MISAVPNVLWKAAQQIEADAMEMEALDEQMLPARRAAVALAECALALDRETEAVNS